MSKRKAKDAFFWCYPSDFLNGIVACESADEVAVYTVALMMIYDAMESIPDDEHAIAWRLKLRPAKVRRLVDKLCTMPGKLIREGDRLHNDRARKWIETRSKLVKNASDFAKKRWDAERKKDEKSKEPASVSHPIPNGHPYASQSHSHITNHQYPSTDTYSRVDAALRSIKGLDRHPVAANPVIGPIVQLVDEGFDLTKTVLPSISAQVQRAGDGRIKTWKYFVSGIRDFAPSKRLMSSTGEEAHAIAPSAAPKVDWTSWTVSDYRDAIFGAKRSGKWWPAFGPPEKIPGELVDDELRAIIANKN